MTAKLKEIGENARKATRRLATLDTKTKNNALKSIAQKMLDHELQIIEANEHDLISGKQNGLSGSLLDRLMLNSERMKAVANDVLAVAALPDPIGETKEERILPNGLRIGKRSVPLGVIGVIYESRPNVTADISALCLKSGNAAILRGGKEARHTNRALAGVVIGACRETNIPEGSVQLIENQDRAVVKEMLTANKYIDMIIPRGGASLHRFAMENATIPVITGGIGICHVFVDRTADAQKAMRIVHNAKVQRPTVCNALDTLIIHQDVAKELLPQIAEKLIDSGVELRCEQRAFSILNDYPKVSLAGSDDFDTEFLSLVLAVKVVNNLDEALDHIFEHSTQHSDAIITEDYKNAMRFVNEVDSAAVYVNTSTRFTDGGQFGLGAEVAVSTQRLHARGPMGLRELTTYKWVVFGDGQIRE